VRNPKGAKAALERAANETDEIDRSLWLAKAADHAVVERAVLVGGAAVNLYTRSYRPTDIDMCAYLDEADRQALQEAGFRHLQGDHFDYEFDDGQRWLIEFPSSQVDGDVISVVLDDHESLTVISLESLIVDRALQATDGTRVTFTEAVRLCVAVFEDADWTKVDDEIRQRNELEPMLDLDPTYRLVVDETGERLKRL
jgi:hypothetical protein